jgi:hypothetical protein
MVKEIEVTPEGIVIEVAADGAYVEAALAFGASTI